MVPSMLTSLDQVFARVEDFRDPRGRRHPLSALLMLVFLGLLARIREMAVLQRWTEDHWELLREPLGFTHPDRPHATTIRRALAKCSLADFVQAFHRWLQQTIPSDTPLTIAVDGKTSCQGLDPHGQPLHMLTAPQPQGLNLTLKGTVPATGAGVIQNATLKVWDEDNSLFDPFDDHLASTIVAINQPVDAWPGVLLWYQTTFGLTRDALGYVAGPLASSGEASAQIYQEINGRRSRAVSVS